MRDVSAVRSLSGRPTSAVRRRHLVDGHVTRDVTGVEFGRRLRRCVESFDDQ